MRNKKPTAIQQSYIDFIFNFKKDYGYHPIVQEIADYFGVWQNAASEMLVRLNKNGFIISTIVNDRTRQITPTESGMADSSVQLETTRADQTRNGAGWITAGDQA